jgi:hypothetical protein
MHHWRVEMHEEALIQLDSTPYRRTGKGAQIYIYSVYKVVYVSSFSCLGLIVLEKGPCKISFL